MANDDESWQKYAAPFVSTLDLKGAPVSITYTDEEIEPTIRKGMCVCKAILLAREGEIVRLSSPNEYRRNTPNCTSSTRFSKVYYLCSS
ncbi:MAG: hypothetical protein ACTSRL_15705 [Candidatus Helarchaeota archaeon]